jgi:predicted dehydrogenase
MRKVKLALTGCGERGIAVGRLFVSHPQCELTAVVDRFKSIAEAARTKLSIPNATIYTDYEKMLKEADIDAVFIASDPLEQVDMACAAMEKGKHVCTEVPAAFSINECWKLVNTVEKTGCKYQLMEQVRYWGFVDECRKMNERGEFGHICLVQGEYMHYIGYEPHLGFWTDLDTGEILPGAERPANRNVEAHWRQKIQTDPIYYLPHTLSPLLKILDDRVIRVSCMSPQRGSYTYPGFRANDLEYSLMYTAGDTVILAGVGSTLPHLRRGKLGYHWYELRGPKASVSTPRYPEDSFRLWREGKENTYEAAPWSSIPLDANADQSGSGHGGADFKPVATFLEAIINDTIPPMDVYLAVETAAPAILAAESAAKGGVLLDVPDFRKKGKKQVNFE